MSHHQDLSGLMFWYEGSTLRQLQAEADAEAKTRRRRRSRVEGKIDQAIAQITGQPIPEEPKPAQPPRPDQVKADREAFARRFPELVITDEERLRRMG